MYNENYDDEILEKIEIMIDKIEKIYKICEKFDSIEQALQDELLAQPAIMKNFDIMHEQVLKIKANNNFKNILSCISEVHLIGLNATRNFSAHDYNKIEFEFIADAIKNDLPSLKSELENVYKKLAYSDNTNIISTSNNNVNKLIKQFDTKIQIYEKIVNKLKTRRDELKNELNVDNTDDDAPPPPSQGQQGQGQGTRHKR